MALPLSPSSASVPSWSPRGSGDLRADRRFLYAREALEAGDAAAAADLARQALDLAPDWPPAWLLLGEALQADGRPGEAVAAFRETLKRDPGDILGAGLRLAALAGVGTPPAMSPAYVAALFDDYAGRFEAHLTQALGYDAPWVMAGLLAAHAAPNRSPAFPHVLDLGCGTGLMAQALGSLAGRVDGCDLSPAMVEQARRRGLYTALAVDDAVDFLARQDSASADLVTAADVLVYVGDPAPLVAGAARALRPGGLLAVTLQTGPAEGYRLGEDLRFHHAPQSLAATCAAHGLATLETHTIVVRQDRGRPLPGAIMVARREAP